jgi:glycosyltransferase involved in cell wall biosynthesis
VIVGLKKRLLDCVVIRADLILVTTERSLRLLEKVCSDKIEKKVFILPNGITKNLFDHVKKQRAERAERILCHLGDLDYKHRNPEPLIKALHELISESRIRRSDVIVEFFGQSGTWNGNSIDDMAKVYGLQGIVRRYESVPHDTALAIMKNCDGLVLLAENQPDMIPAKTYEYLYSGRPILCFADKESATYNLLKDFNNVWLVNSKDMNSAKEAIEQLLNYPRGKERTLTETEMKKISFEHHLSEVIELFHKNERALEYACSEKRREESLRKIDAV